MSARLDVSPVIAESGGNDGFPKIQGVLPAIGEVRIWGEP